MKAYVNGAETDLPDDVFCEWVDRPDTAVISIDMHEGHLSEDPMCPCPAPRGRAIIEPVNVFHRAARAMGVPIIHVRSTLRPTGEDDLKGKHPAAWRTLVQYYADPLPGISEHAIEGSRWTEFCTEVLNDDLKVLTKRRLSPFFATDLDFLLRSMGIKRVVLNGGMTDCCVLNAAFDASNLGYRVCVAKDLVAGSNSEMEDAALKMVSLHLGVVLDSAEVLSTWKDDHMESAAPTPEMPVA
ncbi:isochorismatase family cysteine hydrolase [Maritimibacter sp. UBA3975]|uniref:cysteine hydrolase family protein n=1 Tax=Maritimibacter sp. UBA3975 TaxID=1946833 RepID=UPI000C0A6FA1|nr:isochorismatase family cysteine hydrolase [Maritimibacter sp. UBA3975]MAM60272.1 isochorismatase [Maritimibacter sp.]|tara:strand:+ start:12617 stop:13339 length:723 start_codon:yes stop_codon:yes gene_type:complete